MTRTHKGTIYALIDPRDGKIRYIGKTTQIPVDRLAGHLAKPTNPAMRVWINGLGMQGLTPQMETVTTVPAADLAAEEDRQIRRHANQGHRLFNAPYYQAHLGDLGALRAEPQGAGPRSREAVPALPFAKWVFGPLVRGRADGKVPAWVPGIVVIVGAPVYGALLVLRALFNSAVGIWLLLLGAAASILWDAGFDAAVRDLLLPRLPVEEWSAFWGTYVAPPLAQMAASFAWAVMGVSVLLAGASYAEVAKAAPQPLRRPAESSADIAAVAVAVLGSAPLPRPER